MVHPVFHCSYTLVGAHASYFCLETPYGNVDETYQYFKELLLCHSVKVSICRGINQY
jgi:hypothetical protein